MRRIDLHSHIVTPAYAERLPSGWSVPPQTVGQLRVFMEQHRIDSAVVSMGGAYATRSATMARQGNESLAEIVRDDPSRFGALAIVPFDSTNPDLAAEEIRYALDTLSLDGVAILSNHNGSYVGDPSWEIVFDELERRQAYTFVHPASPPNGLSLAKYPPWLMEFPFETTRALTNLIYTGFLERYTSVRLQFAHLGGASLFLAHRLASLTEREPERAREAPAGAIAYLARQWYDTGLSNNQAALASTLAVAPLERVVFGSDWPYLAQARGADPAEDIGTLDPADRQQIYFTNAGALVPRLTDSARGRP